MISCLRVTTDLWSHFPHICQTLVRKIEVMSKSEGILKMNSELNYIPDWARPQRTCACLFAVHFFDYFSTDANIAHKSISLIIKCLSNVSHPSICITYAAHRSKRNTFIIFSPLRTKWPSRDKMLCACLKFTWCDIVGSRWRVANETGANAEQVSRMFPKSYVSECSRFANVKGNIWRWQWCQREKRLLQENIFNLSIEQWLLRTTP